MDWSRYSIPAMRLEARFGDRVVPAFCQRPQNIWAMVEEAVAKNPDGVAASSTNAPNTGVIFVALKPFEERRGPDLSADAILAGVRADLAPLREAFVFVLAPRSERDFDKYVRRRRLHEPGEGARPGRGRDARA